MAVKTTKTIRLVVLEFLNNVFELSFNKIYTNYQTKGIIKINMYKFAK